MIRRRSGIRRRSPRPRTEEGETNNHNNPNRNIKDQRKEMESGKLASPPGDNNKWESDICEKATESACAREVGEHPDCSQNKKPSIEDLPLHIAASAVRIQEQEHEKERDAMARGSYS
jgi:hypothetical protein